AGLDAVGLAQLEPARAALDDAGADLRVLRELGGGDHARGAGAHDQHVHRLGQLLGLVEAGAGGGRDPRLGRDVAVVVELHRPAFPSAGAGPRSSARDADRIRSVIRRRCRGGSRAVPQLLAGLRSGALRSRTTSSRCPPPPAVTIVTVMHIVYAFGCSARATSPARSMMALSPEPADRRFAALPGRPGKIIAVHLAYASRAAQRGRRPAAPSYFLKPASSVAGTGGTLER